MNLGSYLSFSDRRAVRNAWIAWGLLLLTAATIVVSGSKRSVVPAYRTAALHWCSGQSLYSGDGSGFLYLPQSAILFLPFAWFPPVLGDILWRAVAIATFATGLYRYARLGSGERSMSLFPLMTLIALPLAWDGARNGQATLPLAGLMMLAVAEVAEQRWGRAAVYLSVALAVKPLAAVLMLLMAAIHREMRGRLAVGAALVAVLPFFAQWPSYVVQQYAACLQSLRSTAHLGVVELWAQPFSVLQMLGVGVDERLQTCIRAAAALATLGLCWWGHQRWSQRRYAVYLYALAACYLMLFNPRTENNSYAMLAPAMGLFFAEACAVDRRFGHAALLLVMAGGTVGSYELGKWLVPQWKPVWLAPLMAACFAGYVLVRVRAEVRLPARTRGGRNWWPRLLARTAAAPTQPEASPAER